MDFFPPQLIDILKNFEVMDGCLIFISIILLRTKRMYLKLAYSHFFVELEIQNKKRTETNAPDENR